MEDNAGNVTRVIMDNQKWTVLIELLDLTTGTRTTTTLYKGYFPLTAIPTMMGSLMVHNGKNITLVTMRYDYDIYTIVLIGRTQDE